MGQQLNPYISFDGNCAEAMAFYGRVLGAEPQLMTFRESGMDADGIMHGSLDTSTGFHIFGCDQVEGMGERTMGNNVQVSLSGDEVDALRGYWQALQDGGSVVIPLEKQIWGDEYGQLVDRFGIVWHVNIAGSAVAQ